MYDRTSALATILLVCLTGQALADVDLVTIPTREGVQLTIYNSEDITMVREHRLLTVKPGINRIQFAWAATLIDPTSIDFRILDHVDKVDLIDTTFPSGRNDALQWNIRSQMAGKIPVEIRYFTSGITWKADYVGIANQDETKLNVTGYSGKPVVAKAEIERRFDANVVLWGSEGQPKDWNGNEEGAYVDLHQIDGRVERVDQNHVKYFLDLKPGEKRFVKSSVTYKRRKVGPELNQEKKREPL